MSAFFVYVGGYGLFFAFFPYGFTPQFLLFLLYVDINAIHLFFDFLALFGSPFLVIGVFGCGHQFDEHCYCSIIQIITCSCFLDVLLVFVKNLFHVLVLFGVWVSIFDGFDRAAIAAELICIGK